MSSSHFRLSPATLRDMLVVLITSLPLWVYAYAGLFVRYVADDYCTVNTIHSIGIVPTVAQFYLTWTGIFTAIFLWSASLSFQLGTISVFILLLVWWLASFDMLRIVLAKRQIPNAAIYGALGATLIILATLNGSPTVIQSVYVASGIFSYFLPLVLLTVYGWLVLQSKITGPIRLGLCALVTFFAGGTHIVYTLTAICLFGLACIYSFRKPVFRAVTAGFIGTFFGFVILVAAPGNALRQSYFPKPDLGYAIQSSISSMGVTTLVSLIRSPLFTIAVVILPLLFSIFIDRQPIRVKWYLVLIPIVIFALNAVSFFPGFYAQSQTLVGRAWTIPEFILICGLALWGYYLGAIFKQRRRNFKIASWTRALVGVVVLLLFGWSLITAVQIESLLAIHATAWDQRDHDIRTLATSSDSIQVISFQGDLGMDDLAYDHSFWVNQCMATLYGLKSIEAK